MAEIDGIKPDVVIPHQPLSPLARVGSSAGMDSLNPLIWQVRAALLLVVIVAAALGASGAAASQNDGAAGDREGERRSAFTAATDGSTSSSTW